MILMITFLIVGFILLVKGADFFVDGACDLSEKLKIPAYVIGLTVVAFGTSLPEAAVSVTASLQGSNEIAIGNVIGSNTFNTLVVLGTSALFAPVAVKKNILKRDFPFCIGITVIMLILIMTLNNGEAALTRFDGIVLLILFAVFMAFSVISGRNEAAAISTESESPEKENLPWWKCILYIIIGVSGVIVGGELTVEGAKQLALTAGLSETVVGLTVVAVGTSLPELVTSVVAARKKQNDIAVGNVIGSNIFNILFILGMSSTLGTITTDGHAATDTLVLIGVCVITYLFALINKKINRPAGIVMIILYLAYTSYLLIR
ncbi:MAG: calcium/sodium antiporter [Clostridia bacterium]|nr:calcium/sodium antiporter [Clostridia bacterium]